MCLSLFLGSSILRLDELPSAHYHQMSRTQHTPLHAFRSGCFHDFLYDRTLGLHFDFDRRVRTVQGRCLCVHFLFFSSSRPCHEAPLTPPFRPLSLHPRGIGAVAGGGAGCRIGLGSGGDFSEISFKLPTPRRPQAVSRSRRRSPSPRRRRKRRRGIVAFGALPTRSLLVSLTCPSNSP